MEKIFEPVTNPVKQPAPETIGAVKDTTKAITEIEDILKNAINFDLGLLEPSSEVANSRNTSQFRLRVNPITKRLCLNKNAPIAFHGKSLILTDSNKKFDLESDIFDMMTNFKFNAMSIEHPKDKKLLLDFPDEMRFDIKHTGIESTRDKGW